MMASKHKSIESERLQTANRMLRENAAQLAEGNDLQPYLASVLNNVSEFLKTSHAILWLEHSEAQEGSVLLIKNQNSVRRGELLAIRTAMVISRGMLQSSEVQNLTFATEGVRELASLTGVPLDVARALVTPIVFLAERIGYILVWLSPEASTQTGCQDLLEGLANQVAVASHLADMARIRAAELISEEQQRIARELHDTVAQSITHVAKQLDLIDSSEYDIGVTKQVVTASRKVLRDALADTRRSLEHLSSRHIATRKFIKDFERTLHRQGSRFTGELRLCIELPEAFIGAAAAHEVTRIAQEAVNNAILHADPGLITVSLVAGEGGTKVLIIEDDGCGFSPDTANRSLGLSGMRARVSNLNGVLTTVSSPGEGTRIVVAWVG